MRRLPLLALLLLAPPAAAQPPFPIPVVEQAMSASVRLDTFWAADSLKPLRVAVETDTPYFTADVERELAAKPLEFTRLTVVTFTEVPAPEAPRPIAVLVRTLGRPVDEAALLKTVGGKVELDRGQLAGHPDLRLIRTQQRQVLGVAGNQIVSIDYITDRPEARPMLARLFTEARKRDAEAEKDAALVRLAVNGKRLTDTLWPRDRDAMPPQLRMLLTSEAGELTVHLRPGGTVRGVTQTPALVIRGTATFADDKAAAAGEGAAKELLQMAAGFLTAGRAELAKEYGPTFVPLIDGVSAAVKSARVTTDGKTAVLTASTDLTPAFSAALAAVPKKSEEAAVRTVSANNLKQIGLSLHNYESTFAHLPGDILSKAGTPLLSWRVAVLPYLEQEKLYAEFKLDEPWDSDHNRKLLPRMPKVYAVPTTKAAAGMTFYRGFVGKKNATARPLFVEGGLKRTLLSITDGTSNTLMVVEAAVAVEWTKPADLPFAPDGPLPKLGGHFGPGFHAVFCDGHVRFLPADLPAAKLRALVTADGGEVVDGP